MSKQISNNGFDSLDEFFNDKLKDASMQPPEKVWQQIEGLLNKDKKRKRGFIWLFFCGLLFIGLGMATYVFIADKTEVKNSKKADIKVAASILKKETTATLPKEATTNMTQTDTVNTKENIVKEEKINTVQIQLGAFRNQVDKAIFNKTQLEIKSETNDNGITRYYAEIPENESPQALMQVKQAGFANAFIKRNTLLATKNNSSDKKPLVSQPKSNPTLTITQNMVLNKDKESILPQPTNTKKGANTTSKANVSQQNNNVPVSANKEFIAINTTPQQNQIKDSSEIKNAVINPTVTHSSEPNQDALVKDSLQKDTIVEPVVSNKKDSVLAKPDSIKSLIKADSSIKELLLNRWALLLTGGPNFFLKNTQNNLFDISGEKQPITYNTSFKIEYRLFKKIALSVGLNYSCFTARQDATLFYFPKNLSNDFIFYSSYGPMAVDKNTMLQGYSPLAPVTMFHANYSYTSKVNTLLIPIEAKWYYVNGKKINLYAALGGSAMLVLSEQTNLSIIKEHITNNVSYSQINTTKLNALLMLGFGGDIKLYKQLYFTVDGGFRYCSTNLSNTAGIRTNLAYFSANGGLKIKL